MAAISEARFGSSDPHPMVDQLMLGCTMLEGFVMNQIIP